MPAERNGTPEVDDTHLYPDTPSEEQTDGPVLIQIDAARTAPPRMPTPDDRSGGWLWDAVSTELGSDHFAANLGELSGPTSQTVR